MWWFAGCASVDPPSAPDTGAWADLGSGPTEEEPRHARPAATGEATPPAVALPGVGPIRVYAVRHAEKGEGEDPSLTEEGEARAQALADLLSGVPLDAVYATDLARTQETVQPTADQHALPVITRFDPYEELAMHILGVHRGDTVLHAGHSYTLPSFFSALGVEDPPEVDGYGQIWKIG